MNRTDHLPVSKRTLLLPVLCAGLLAACGTDEVVPPPAAPYELTGELVGGPLDGTDINLSWKLDDTSATELVIERKTDEEFAQVAAIGGGERSWTDANPPKGSIYTYRLRAKNASGESDYSNELTVAKPALGGLIGRPEGAVVKLSVVFSKDLNRPSGIGVHPVDGSVWLVNRGDDTTVIIDGFDTPNQRHVRFFDDSHHFMNNPTQLSFSDINTFGTCQETANDYNGMEKNPNLFMGPVVWTADRKDYEGGTMSHYDMLHETPMCMGITSIGKDEYWVFNGHDSSIDQNFFGEFHPLGEDDHTDGKVYRHVEGQVKRVPDVPSHMVYNPADKYVYIADTGNGRVVRISTEVDLSKAKYVPVGQGARFGETPLYKFTDTRLEPVAGKDEGMVQPTGLALYDNWLIVSDHATSRISVFDTVTGKRLTYVDASSQKEFMGGLLVHRDRLYVLDLKYHRVLRVDVTL